MKKYSLIIALCLLTGSILGQQVDQQKMDKDLEVAQTVLNSLLKDKRSSHWTNESNIRQTQYIEGYGAILTLPIRPGFNFNMPPPPPMPDISKTIAKGFEIIEDIQIDIDDEEVDDEVRAEMEKERAERRQELALRQAELEKRAAIAMERAQFKIQQMDSMRLETEEDNIESVVDFLLDYGQLISQLKNSDKILVMAKGEGHRFYRDLGIVKKVKASRLSVEANVADLRAFQSGKIDREEAKSRIVISKEKEEVPLAKDLTIFQTILKRLYASDLSDTYYLNGDMQYEQIEGLGVIFFMNMVSSIRSGEEGWNIPTQDKENLSQVERDELIKDLYPKFEKELKENIIEYSQNVKSLADNEQLIFKVNITKCEGCGIPENIELRIKAETLVALKAGKLNKAQALKEIKVVKGDMQ